MFLSADDLDLEGSPNGEDSWVSLAWGRPAGKKLYVSWAQPGATAALLLLKPVWDWGWDLEPSCFSRT